MIAKMHMYLFEYLEFNRLHAYCREYIERNQCFALFIPIDWTGFCLYSFMPYEILMVFSVISRTLIIRFH